MPQETGDPTARDLPKATPGKAFRDAQSQHGPAPGTTTGPEENADRTTPAEGFEGARDKDSDESDRTTPADGFEAAQDTGA